MGAVVVNHAYRLHEGVADGAADEFEAALAQVFAQTIGECSFCGYLTAALPVVDDWAMVDKAP